MLALVFNQPQGGQAAPPATPQVQSGGGGVRLFRAKESGGATARQRPMRAAVASVASVRVRTGARAVASAGLATAWAGRVVASGAAVARVRTVGIARAVGMPAVAVGVHNPTGEDLLVLGWFFPGLMKAARHVKPIDRQRYEVLHAEAAIKAHMHAFLHLLALRLASMARGHHVHKAAGADDEVKAAAEATDFDPLEQSVAPYIRAVAKDGAREGLKQVGADLDKMLSQANVRAVEWANDHAGVLIKGIGQTTRERVAELTARALDEGWSNDTLADELAGAGVFSESRAEMVARTETAYADVQGSLIGWKESGVVEGKEWKVAQDNECDLCADMDGEVVGIDEEFPDGDPPLHPNCRCDVLPVLADAE